MAIIPPANPDSSAKTAKIKSLCAAPRGMATYVDVGANLTDGMFRGVYRGKRAHEDDLGAVLRRAREAGVVDAREREAR